MITAKPSREIREAILDGVLKPSPLEKVGHQLFLRFDSLHIERTRIAFSYGGKKTFYIEIPGNHNPMTDTLTIDGIEGRMQCNLSI